MCRVQWQSIGGDGTLGGDNEEAGFNIIPPTHQPANSQRPNLFHYLKNNKYSFDFRKVYNKVEVRHFFQPQIFIFEEVELVFLGMC